MARVSDAQWSKLANAVLDAVIESDPMDRERERVIQSVDGVYPRVSAMLDALIEFGAVRATKVGDAVYLDPAQLSRDGLRAMREVWKGNFPLQDRRDRVSSSQRKTNAARIRRTA
jgi:hypothetical protein